MTGVSEISAVLELKFFSMSLMITLTITLTPADPHDAYLDPNRVSQRLT